MNYNFDTIIERHNTDCIKYDEACKRNPLLPADNIPMWIADMDFACPQPILDAIRSRLDKQILGYTDITDAFREVVVGWMQSRHGWSVPIDQLVHFPGVVSALHAMLALMTSPGDGVVIQPPIYPPFLDSIQRAGRRPVYNMLLCDNGYYTIDWDDLAASLADPSVTLLILCNPHNPTGRVWTEQELRRIAQLCFDNGVRIIADEIHSDLVRVGQRHLPLAMLLDNDPRIVTCTAPSKTFNLAGNQQSNIFVPDKALRDSIPPHINGHPNPLSMAATAAAYTHCAGWLDELCSYLDGNMTALRDILAQRLPQAVYRIPEGTYLSWVDLRCTGLSHTQLMEVLMRDAAILPEDGNRYVAGGDGWLRINCACPRSVLVEAANRLCDTLVPYCK